MKNTFKTMLFGFAAIHPLMAMEDTLCQKTLTFKDQSEISLFSNGDITIRNEGEVLTFNDHKDVAVFDPKNGEKVIEYTGVATDKNQKRSWAKAFFEASATSPKHFHKGRVEDYYITSANAQVLVIVDGYKHFLTTGDHVQILPNQYHQVINLSSTDPFSLVVKCTPAWIVEDYNI